MDEKKTTMMTEFFVSSTRGEKWAHNWEKLDIILLMLEFSERLNVSISFVVVLIILLFDYTIVDNVLGFLTLLHSLVASDRYHASLSNFNISRYKIHKLLLGSFDKLWQKSLGLIDSYLLPLRVCSEGECQWHCLRK
ncbi:hypothetical protein G4B88_008002 [Cannabis sativa]|uniref:Uncharacterized protein n=1 Tax=Cannabis sativa TaxID=3483 RepID=A0A7J6I7R5_CANSA|nr:hypothetical protein G4B88_008002 [Cannabis sativa]